MNAFLTFETKMVSGYLAEDISPSYFAYIVCC